MIINFPTTEYGLLGAIYRFYRLGRGTAVDFIPYWGA